MENPTLRLYVLDESLLMAWMVERLSPPGTEVVGLTSFREARRALLENAPDAFIVSITSAHLPWKEFCELCANSTPPVPVLCESSIFATAAEAGLESFPGAPRFLHTPASISELAEALADLLGASSEVRGEPRHPGSAA